MNYWHLAVAGFEDSMKGAQMPRNMGSLQLAEKVKKWTLSWSLQKGT
jgi:hypothetical protein